MGSANQAALNAAMAGGGTVTFAVNGTIYLTNTIVVSNNTVLDATGHSVAISGSNSVQIFIINSGTTLAITNLTMRDGFVQGATQGYDQAALGGYGDAISNAGTLQVTDCAFLNNSADGGTNDSAQAAEGDAGAIYNTGTLEATYCTFSNNSAVGARGEQGGKGAGGAVYNAGILSALGSVFIGNSAVGGPASVEDFNGASYPGGPANGGALFNSNQATFINCVFSNNTATGGIGEDSTPNFQLSGGTGGAANGGALCNIGSLVASSSTFAQNAAAAGQGGQGGHSPYPPNYGFGYSGGPGGTAGNAAGGGICSLSGSSVLINDTFWSNSAVGGAGGMGGAGTGALMYYGVGGAGGNGGVGGAGLGGAIGTLGNSLNLTNLTIASNVAVGGAGGAGGWGGVGTYGTYPGLKGANGPPGMPQGGSLANSNGTLSLINSILAANSPSDTNIFGAITDAGYNISFDNQSSLTNSSSRNGINPMLAPLGDYGGPTPTTALLPGSPAIDGADPGAFPATDQRGFARSYGAGPDIGAFEYSPPNITLESPGSGMAHLVFPGIQGQTYRIQKSSDLLQWQPVCTNTMGASSCLDLYVLINQPNCFYRIVSP